MGDLADDLYDKYLEEEYESYQFKQQLLKYSDSELMHLVELLGLEAPDFLSSVYRHFKVKGYISHKQKIAVVRMLSSYSETYFECRELELLGTILVQVLMQ
jgi:hypothetical protein